LSEATTGFIPVSEPLLGEAEARLVMECLRTGHISGSGEFLDRFENDWADYCGRTHGVAASNGTVALQLALSALDLGPGDEVILPSFTIISCALAVLRTGATPVLVDVDPGTWCMDVDAVAGRITSRTRAVMPVHIYGHPVDMRALLDLADSHGIAVIEDSAEAHGAECETGDGWRRCGSFGTASVFSFYANKPITTGEGGMVLTDDSALAERLRTLRNLAFGPKRFIHEELGFNFRLTNLQAAIGVAQIARLDDVLRRKRRNAATYRELLGDAPGIRFQEECSWARPVHWMVGVELDAGLPLDAAELGRRLGEHGIETRPFFTGMHEQPAFRRLGLFTGERYPVTERIARRGLYLPSGPGLHQQDVERVAAAVRGVLR
jgi:perosamine synthetase